MTVVGLGPGDLDRIPPDTRSLLLDPTTRVMVRTLRHPAAHQLSEKRPVESCDDLYEQAESFEDVYRAIAERVIEAAPVVYAVPGSPLIGELAVARLRALAEEAGIELQVRPAESFVDAVLAALGVDPLDRGLQVLDAHRLPNPLVLDKPTVVGHLDTPVVLADTMARLGRVLDDDAEVTVLIDVGAAGASVTRVALRHIDPQWAGLRTSLFVDADPGGLVGVVQVMRRLREECPWDHRQTHHSLVKNLVEETFELVEALSALPEGGEPDWGGYAEVEDELGDLLLQVIFHTNIAREAGAFDIDDVGEVLRRKLVRRHPHVFSDVVVGSAEEVKANWDRLKAEERGEESSAMDGVPAGLPGLHRAARLQRRAASVGFDWPAIELVLAKVREEVEELGSVLDDRAAAAGELGDLLFAVVNLARHLEVDPEVALRASIERFVTRFRAMEAMGPLKGLTLEELDARWETAKQNG